MHGSIITQTGMILIVKDGTVFSRSFVDLRWKIVSDTSRFVVCPQALSRSSLFPRRIAVRALLALLAAGSMLVAEDGTGVSAPVSIVRAIPLPRVEGRIDHMSCDPGTSTVFLAALGNGTLEVISLDEGKVVCRVPELKEPQGVLVVPGSKEVVVAGGGDGTLKVYDRDSLKLGLSAEAPPHLTQLHALEIGDDADNVRYDEVARRVYVGYGEGALAVIDALKWSRLGDIKLEGHPESFQLEKEGKRIFVNVPRAGHVAVVDREKGAVTEKWTIEGAGANFPMAVDEKHHRLFVGCRKPPRLVVLDTETGKTMASMECGEDTDDLFHDAARSRIYASCGAGVVDVFQEDPPERWRLAAKVSTAQGARTSLFVPQLHRLLVAVPHRGSQGAEVLVYATER